MGASVWSTGMAESELSGRVAEGEVAMSAILGWGWRRVWSELWELTLRSMHDQLKAIELRHYRGSSTSEGPSQGVLSNPSPRSNGGTVAAERRSTDRISRGVITRYFIPQLIKSSAPFDT